MPWPDPTPEMLTAPEFEAVWQCIKTWDIRVPEVYEGYCGATGNHVRAILDALAAIKSEVEWTSDGVRKLSDHDLSARLVEELELCYNSARISLLKAEVRRRKQPPREG